MSRDRFHRSKLADQPPSLSERSQWQPRPLAEFCETPCFFLLQHYATYANNKYLLANSQRTYHADKGIRCDDADVQRCLESTLNLPEVAANPQVGSYQSAGAH